MQHHAEEGSVIPIVGLDGPFLAQLSKHTLDKEHLPLWSPPRTRPQTVVDEGRRRASVPEYTAKTPWPEKTFRPATAGRKHEQPTWYPTPSIQYVIVKSIARRCLCLLLLVRDHHRRGDSSWCGAGANPGSPFKPVSRRSSPCSKTLPIPRDRRRSSRACVVGARH